MKISLISYDNDDYIGHLPLGLAYLTAALKGHDVQIIHQDIEHIPDNLLYKYLKDTDMVGVGVCGGYYQYQRLKEISKAINSMDRRPFYVIGGAMVSPEPQYFLDKMEADAIVVGEGEKAILNVVESMKAGIYEEPIEDIDSIEWPAYDKFPISHYKKLRRPHATNKDFVLPIMSGRGCPFKCNFCYQIGSFRKRNISDIMSEILFLKKYHNINYNYFADDLLMSSEGRIIDFCEKLLSLKDKNKWSCSGRLNFASKKILELMKRAGCVFVNYGIESVNDDMLKVMNKNLTVSQIVNGIENTLNAGISPGLNIIWGNIGETIEHLMNGVNFLLKYDDGVQIRTIKPVTPYPGTALYNYAIEKGMLENVEDFYERKHKNSDLLAVNFTDLTDAEFHMSLYKANEALLNNYYKKQCKKSKKTMYDMYALGLEFRGFRRS